MIKINNIYKIYNKGKQNEIRAIDNVSLSFPDKGLVCILGPSGCGKTSLLNVIGGLDSADTGTVNVDGYVYNKYNANKVDFIRNNYIGYVFQNYVLFPNLSVYENLEIVLSMFDIDKNEASQRIEYALKKVNMDKFKKRLCKNLSGGQKQRVAIARALVKAPRIIIADEPTGNLDGKNTTQIMNIIKKLSNDCLVILVTHETRLASFYGDYIIEIKDGKVVKECNNTTASSYDYQDNQNIYLQDYKKEISFGKVTNNIYYNDENFELTLDIVYKDNVIYLKANGNALVRFVNENDEVKFIDDKKPILDFNEIDRISYDLSPIKIKQKSNVIKYRNTFKTAWDNIKRFGKRQKFYLFTFFLSAIIIVISFINLSKVYGIDDAKYIVSNNDTVEIRANNLLPEEIKRIENDLNVKVYPHYSAVSLRGFSFDLYEQSAILHQYNPLTISYVPNTILGLDKLKTNLIYGSMPTCKNEIIIDKYIIENFLESDNNSYIEGITSIEKVIGQSAVFDYYYDAMNEYTITGISDTNYPLVFMNEDEIKKIMVSSRNSFNFKMLSDIDEEYYYETNTKEKKPISSLVLGSNDILVSNFISEAAFDSVFKLYNVIGIVETNESFIVGSKEILDEAYYSYLADYGYVLFESNDVSNDINYLQNLGISYSKLGLSNEINRENYIMSAYGDASVFVILIIISLALSFVFMFITMRASLILRVNEVGTYRALGVRKSEVYKMFIAEIFLITLISSGLGYLVSSSFVWNINSQANMVIINYPWYMALLALGSIFVGNFIFGLIPVIILLRKTPTQILTKYDI